MIYNTRNIQFEEFDHTADIGITAAGSSLESIFAAAAFGMRHIILGDVDVAVKNNHTIGFKMKASDIENLLVEWLSELNYGILVKNFIFEEFENLKIVQNEEYFKISVTIKGDNSLANLNHIKTEIKAVTYHHLTIKKENNHFYAKVIFDI